MTKPNALLEVQGVSRSFGGLKAVQNVSLEVPQGSLTALIGPNGAGKSTTMKMISSVSQRTSGDLKILGKEPNTHGPEIRAHLGAVPQKDLLDRELKVWENIFTYGRYFGLSRKFLK